MNAYQEIQTFWNNRAVLGLSAGTKDLIAKELEIKAISKYIRSGMNILEAGCGNGVTALKIASTYPVHIEGFDYAEEMINEAKKLAANASLKGTVNFKTVDLCHLPANIAHVDLVYTERVLINLKSWDEQKKAIKQLCNLLVNGGCYVMCENSMDGLEKINSLRQRIGLNPISPPWHNRYLWDAEIEQLIIPDIRLETIDYFTSTYHLLSRVINAALAFQEGREPEYNAPINQLAYHLPPIGDLGQTRIWVWRKMKE